MTDVKLVQLQGSVFMAGLVMQDKVGLAAKLNDVAGRIFDGDTAVLPLPEDASPEIPRIILRSKSESRLLQLSEKRLDVLILRTSETGEPINLPNPEISQLLTALRDSIADAAGRSFGRAALISSWVVQLDNPAREFMRERYMRKGSPAESAIELEIHALERAPILACDSNQWVRARTARKADAPEDDRYVTVLVDINSSPDKSYDFAGSLLGRYLEESQLVLQALLIKHIGQLQ